MANNDLDQSLMSVRVPSATTAGVLAKTWVYAGRMIPMLGIVTEDCLKKAVAIYSYPLNHAARLELERRAQLDQA